MLFDVTADSAHTNVFEGDVSKAKREVSSFDRGRLRMPCRTTWIVRTRIRWQRKMSWRAKEGEVPASVGMLVILPTTGPFGVEFYSAYLVSDQSEQRRWAVHLELSGTAHQTEHSELAVKGPECPKEVWASTPHFWLIHHSHTFSLLDSSQSTSTTDMLRTWFHHRHDASSLNVWLKKQIVPNSSRKKSMDALLVAHAKQEQIKESAGCHSGEVSEVTVIGPWRRRTRSWWCLSRVSPGAQLRSASLQVCARWGFSWRRGGTPRRGPMSAPIAIVEVHTNLGQGGGRGLGH